MTLHINGEQRDFPDGLTVFDAKGLIGRRFDDLGVLAIARTFEAIRAYEERPWPEPPTA